MSKKRTTTQKPLARKTVRKRLLLETMEDRILCSATVAPAAVDPKEAVAVTAAAETPSPAPMAVAPVADATAAAPQAAAQPAAAPQGASASLPSDASQLTDEQRAAIQDVVRESTNQIWFEQNVGQFAEGVRYGFKTQFGAMLVYDDHLTIITRQIDPATGKDAGTHSVDISFTGGSPWQIVPGGESGVLGSYQQADGTSLTPQLSKEITLRNVYSGVDLRLYSAQNGVLEFDWIVAHAQDYAQIRIAATGQDGIIFNDDGSATFDLRYNDLTMKMPETYQVINGVKHQLGARMVAGENPGEIRYAITGDIVADQPLVIDPNVAWSTYFELNDPAFDSYLYAIAINANGVYCAGWTAEIINNGSFGNYMQVNAGFAQGSGTGAAGQNYIYRFNTSGTAITAWTATGIVGSSGNTPPTDMELFPDGRVLVSYSNGRVQIYSAALSAKPFDSLTPIATSISTINSVAIVSDTVFYIGGLITAANNTLVPVASTLDSVFAGTSEGIIVRYTLAGAVATANWATYIGGANTENFTAIALTPDLSKLVFAVHSVEAGTTLAADAYPTLVNAVDSTPDTVAGRTEILTGVINEQVAKPAAFDVFSLLGGSGTEGTTGTNSGSVVVTAKNTGYWVGGNTASTDLPGTAGGAQATNGGGTNDSFLSYIPINGSAGVGFQSTYIGGIGAEIMGGIAYDPVRLRVFAFGTTTGSFPVQDTTPTSLYYDSSFGGGAVGDIFISTFNEALTVKDYATYVGGTFNDYLGDTGLLRGQGHVAYSSATDQVYLATTVHSNLPTTVIGPSIPGFDTTRSNPESASADAHVIFAFNISIFDHGDAPASYEAGTPAADGISALIRIGATVDAEAFALSGAAATGDDLKNSGALNDEDGIATLPSIYTSDSTYSVTVSVFNNLLDGLPRPLNGWIDFNGDGVFTANERASVSVPNSPLQQSVTLTWASLPGIVSGQSYLRLRFSETAVLDNLGTPLIDESSIGTNNVATGHGEIEDYALTINALSSLSGFVYSELNGNGTKDAFEGGIPGAQVRLTGTNIRGTAVNVLTTTDAAGFYTFGNLLPSNGAGYTLTETQPAGYADGVDTIGTQGGTAGNDVFSAIVISNGALGAGVNGINNNFGETPGNFTLTKSLQTTSVAGTVSPNVAVGETATFRLVVSVPAGGFTDFQIQDALPPGYQYVNGSAVVALVSSAGQLTSSTLSGAGLAQTSIGTPTFVMPDAAVSDNSISNSDSYASGTDVFFKLGNLTNVETTAAVESVVIEFQAVVLNEAGNQAATSLPNTFTALFEKNGVAGPETHGVASNSVSTTVVEPVLGVTKAVAVSGSDAGDAVQYTITITNPIANAATAYDINVLDVLAGTLTFGSVSVVGASIITNTTVGNNLNIVLDSLAAGSSATVTINATVATTASAGSTVGNTTNITWTSTPGANANERTGGGGLNDYSGSASSGNFVLALPTVDKLTPADTTYSVGETVTYDILVTLPEGVTTGLAITDNLPAGLNFVSAAVQTAAGGALANAFNGTVTATPAQSNIGNSYTFTFGDTTTNADNVANNNSFLVRVTARIANVIGNQNAVTLTNTATLAYTDGTLGATTVVDPTPNVNVTVVEPILTLAKTVVGASTGFDAGDTAQFQIVITNTGTATANEVTLSDALPAGLLITTINSTTPAGGATVDVATAGVGTANLTGEYTIPVGGSITVLYTATLQTSVTPNTSFTNTATVVFSSVDGTALGQGTATGERIGTSPNIQGDGSLNDYRLQSSAAVSTGGVLTVAKGVNNATPSIGDVLTYTVTLTLNEGTTNGIVVTDTLPASGDLQFVAGSAAVSFGTAGSSISGSTIPVISGGGSNILTFTLGTAVVPAGVGANTVVLTYQVLVRNVITNQAGDVESNNAHVVATGLATPPDSSTSVTLREPNVTFTKNASATSNVDAGDVITYTVTLTNPGGANASTAFDSLLVDTMPANLLVTGITSTTLAGGATADSAAAITGGGAGLTGQYDIPVGATVTVVYTATVQTGFPTNGSVTNAAVLTWTSQNGGNSTAPDANERFGAAASTFGDGSRDDYRRTTSVTSTGAGPTFTKTLFATSDPNTAGSNVAVGEQVTYALLVTLPEGTTSSFNVLDTLPPGLRYVSYTIEDMTGAANPLTADFGGTVPTPTFTGGASDGDDVNFAFGAITTNGDNVTTNNTFAIMITAEVTDVVGNSGLSGSQTVLPNSATFSGPGIPPTTPPPVNATVTEPRLVITKAVDDPTADLGQVLTYTLTIAHTASSTAPAYDLIIRDAIPADFTLNVGSVTIAGGAIATNTSTASQLALTIDQFNVGGTITITYTATVGTGAALGGTNQDNNVRLYWDTTAADTGTNTVLNGGTDGDNDRDFGATPLYVEAPTPTPDDPAQDTVRVTVNANTVSGFVYLDSDSSGTRNGAETGLGVAVNVTISGTTFFGAGFSQTVAANAATGAYTFTNVPRSDATGYTITETQPGGFVDGIETAGVTFGGTTNNALGADAITNVVVPGGSGAGAGYNFGELLGSSLAGFTYLDLNNDGTKQGGETGLGTALPVALTGTDVFGQAVSLSTTSDAGTGAWSLTGLRPSNVAGYTIAENDAAVVPATLLDGTDTVGSLGGAVTGAGPKFDAFTVSVAQNQAGANYNFAEIQKSSLAGFVYVDVNNDGIKQGGEAGIGGTTMTLTGTDDRGTAVSVTTTTAAITGAYVFSDLRPSNGAGYTITEGATPAYLDGLDTIGTPGGVAGNDVFSAIVLAPGVTGANNNFGETPASSLSGFVYDDANNDGIKQGGEAGIGGITITLTGTDNLGGAVSLTTTTAALTGAYSFIGLRPSDAAGYTITEGATAGFLDGADTIGTPGGTAGNDVFSAIVLASGANGANNNFGELSPSSLAGFVYNDANNDGIKQGGEAGIGGITITLTGTDDRGNAVSQTVTTAALTGAYTFIGLRPSNGAGYTITEGATAGFLDGTDTIGTPGGTAGNDVLSGIVLASGTGGANNNFGELSPSSLAGFVYDDANNDGIKQGGEAGIGGITITLTGIDDRGNAVSQTVTTAAVTGAYSFVGLRPSNGAGYTITEGATAGFLDGIDTIGTPGGTAGNDVLSGIVLASGTGGANNNFGELSPSSLSGFVYDDANNDGIKQGGEAGIGGITITLTGTDDLGNAVNLTTTTAALTGAYSFTNLRPSAGLGYSITEGATPGFLDGLDTIGTQGGDRQNDLFDSVAITSGISGANYNFGELSPSSFSGFVYDDANNDGIKQGGEAGIGGITITLTGTDDLGTVLNLTATTSALTGAYTFTNLRPSNGTGYTITEGATPGFLDGTDTIGTPGGTAGNDVFSAVVLAPGTSGANNNFGELSASSLSGFVYDDTNNDGAKQGGETGIGGITITLSGTDDLGNAVNLTTTSAALTGAYTFTNLRPSNGTGYTITEGATPGFLDGTDTIGTPGGTAGNDIFTGVVLAPSTSGADNNFGELTPSSFSGFVYDDLNNDAAKQVGEAGIGGITITLSGTDDLGNAVSLTTTTAALTGAYTFTNLRPSNGTGYTITEGATPGFLDGTDTIGTPGGTAGNDIFTGVVLAPSTSGADNNFGELTPSSFSGFVYDDGNNDGTKQVGEAGIGGITITLTGTDDLGNAVSLTTTTAALTGAYTFTSLRPSNGTGYTITEGATPGFLDGIDTIGTQGGTAGNDVFTGVVLGPNTSGADNNFAELTGSLLTGFVYNDANNDGALQVGEVGIGGATITLTGIDDLGNTVNLTTTTDPGTGAYGFTSLRPGTYTLSEAQPAGFLDGTDAVGSQGGTPGNDVFSAILLAAGTSGANNNFGELAPSSFSGFVYQDANNDGIKQVGETGISGITITLTGTDDRGNAVNLTTTTDALTGAYAFAGLRPSDGTGYTITEGATPGYLDGTDTIGTPGGTAGNDVFTGVVLASDTAGANNNFGELSPSSFSGFVYDDANNDGIKQAGEAGIGGITITLTGTDDLGNAVSVTTTSAALTGAYSFTGLRPSNGTGYTITEGATPGFLDGTDTIGTPGGTAGNDVFSGVVLASGTTGANNNFGELAPSSFSGFVYDDANNDGIKQGGEAGIGGITITLSGTDDLGNAVSVTTTSAALTGAYSFTGLRPSNGTGYTITEGATPGFLDGTDTIGTPGGTAGNDVFSGVVLASGTSGANNNFGELTPSSFSGFVYDDANNDGIKQGGEAGIGGITITLSGTDDLGNAVSVTTTSAALTGAYSFTGLRPSNGTGYTITEGATPGFLDGTDTIGTPGGTAGNDVFTGVVLASGTSGANNNFGELTPSSLSGTVYADLNNNGSLDAFERGVPGVTITLTGTDDQGAPVNLTVTTNAGGLYSFANIRPSDATGYTISETQPADYADGADTIGTPGGNATVNDVFSAVVLTAGTSGTNNNFGEQPNFTLTKTLVSTSEAGTPGSSVAVGEVATFRLVVTIPAGSLTDFQVQDLLPAGYVYVNGSARAGLVGAVTSSTVTAPLAGIGATPGYTLLNADVSDNALTNSDGYVSGTDVFFKFGNLVNPDATAAVEAIVIEFDARVVNELANTAGTVLTNSFSILYERDGAPGPDPDPNPLPPTPVPTTIVSPVLTFAKSADITSNVDAGDVITYTLTITNPGGVNGSTAFDALVADTMPANLLVTGIAGTTLLGGATADSAAAITGGGAGLGGQYDIPAGGSVTIVYTATVQVGFPTNGSVTNAAVLTWTSLNGGNSTAPDANERYGDPVSVFGDGSLNDFRRTTGVTTTGAAPAFSKTLFATSDATTLGGNVTVGETVTYALLVTLPEGTTGSFNVLDRLPPGLRYVGSSIETVAGPGNPLTADFGGTVPAPTITGGVADGDDVNFAFGAITTNSDNVTTNNTFVILVTAVVTDVPANSGVTPQTVLSNSATFDGPGIPPSTPPPVDVTVSEPRLVITKGVDDPTADLGQVLTYTLTINHTASSTATAYDLILQDAIPAGFTLDTGSIAIAGGVIATDTSTASQLALTIDQFAVGGTITITYQATVGTAAALGGTNQDNNVRLYWDTTPADTGTNTVLTGGTDGDEDRDFGATPLYVEAPAPAPDDLAQDTVRVTVNGNTISGVVYADADASGTLNGAEAGVGAGVQVTISGLTFFGAPYSQTVTADPVTGIYTFTNVPRSDVSGYTITEVQPAGLVDGAETAGTLGGGVSDALGSNTITGIVIPVGNNSGTDYNFGEVLPSSLSGFVYSDANNDGIVQITEALLDGVAVDITGVDFLGQAVSISTTTVGGAYSAANLRPGTYTITETQPVGYFDGLETVGSQGSGTVNNTVDSNTISAIALTQGVDGAGNNFGELAPASLTGIVFDDRNNDGNVNFGESGILNATVVLSGTDDRGNPVNATLTTLADGTYSFGNLRPGNYTITETTPAGFLDGIDTAGTLGGSTALNDVISGIALGAGQTGADNRFGELTPASLGGVVFSDLNNDGAQGAGEAGVGGVTVTLSGTDDLGNTINTSTLTLGDGTYNFGTLRPGNYTITETQPGAFLDGIDTAGTLGGSTAVNDVVSGINVAPAQNGTGYTFGELVPSSLNGFVFIDTNNDGIFDLTESGQGGVTVALTGFDDLGNAVNLTTLTLGDGSYGFVGLRPSDSAGYTITETQPVGLLDGKNAVGTAGGTTVNNPPSDVISSVVLLNANTTAAGYDFGELQPATISGLVFQDFNLDGSFNGPDSGLIGVTVTLTGTDDLGGTVNVATTTNGAGVYSFGTLRPGTYAVTETQPAGYDDGNETVGNAGGTLTANDVIGGITVGSGTSATGYTFAEIFPFDPTKAIASTSNPGTAGSDLSIGEVVRYHMIVSLPDGTLPSTVLQDLLPAGLVFLNDGTATVSLVSLSGSAITSSTLSGPGLGGTDSAAAPSFVLPGSAISSNLTSDVDVYGSGTDVYFKLGNLTNTETNVPGGQYAVIEFNARVENIPANRLGTPLPNTFRLLFDLNADGTPDVPPVDILSNPAQAAVAEPILFLDKQLVSGSTTPAQNDILTFTVTIGHATGSNATAWETVFSDLLPKGLQLESITTSASGGAVITQAATSDANGTLSGQFDIPVGGQIVITYRVKVTAAAGNGGTLVNAADVTWTSLPGDSAVERKSGDSLYGGGGLNDSELRDEVRLKPFTFAFDGFHNFSKDRSNLEDYRVHSPDIFRLPLLPLAPIYSGEADPGSTLVLTIYNANGETIGTQTVIVDTGGNWLATFPTTVIRDYPNSVQITQSSAFYSLSDRVGHNLRTYFSPALSAGHFFFEEMKDIREGEAAPLLGDLGMRNPLSLGAVKYGGELLGSQGAPGGY